MWWTKITNCRQIIKWQSINTSDGILLGTKSYFKTKISLYLSKIESTINCKHNRWNYCTKSIKKIKLEEIIRSSGGYIRSTDGLDGYIKPTTKKSEGPEDILDQI